MALTMHVSIRMEQLSFPGAARDQRRRIQAGGGALSPASTGGRGPGDPEMREHAV